MSTVLSFIALCFIWGSTWLAIKIGLADLPPFLFAGVRCFVAALILYGLVLFRGETIPFSWRRTKGPIVFGLTNGIGLGLVFWGEQYISSSLTATLNATLPFFSAICAYFLVAEKLSLKKFIGLGVGFVGVLTIFSENLGDFAGAKVLGELSVIGAAAFYALGGAFAKRFHNDLKQIPAVALQQFFSAVALLPIGLILEHDAKINISWPSIAAFFYLVIVGSVVAFILYYNLLLKIEFTKLSYISMITPVVATVIGVIWGHEAFKVQYLIGLVLICGGMAFVNLNFAKLRARWAA